MEPLMKLWSLVRVNDIHIGTNKKFTLLFHNTKNTKVTLPTLNCMLHYENHVCLPSIYFHSLYFQLEGRVALVSNSLTDASVDIHTNTVDLTFEHKFDDEVLHKLSIVFVIQNDKAVSRYRKSDQIKLQLAVIHTNKNRELWMVSDKDNVFIQTRKKFQ